MGCIKFTLRATTIVPGDCVELGTAESAMLGSVHTDAQAHLRYKLQLQTVHFTIFLTLIYLQ